MDVGTFLQHVHNRTDLELAVLLSLIAQQHCLISTADQLLDELASELALIVSEQFGLSYAVIDPENQQSVDKFGEAILNPHHQFDDNTATTTTTTSANSSAIATSKSAKNTKTSRSDTITTTNTNTSSATTITPSKLASVSIRANSTATASNNNNNNDTSEPKLDKRTVTNVIIAKGFNHASRDVQIAVLELIQRRRIYSHTTVHPVPKVFLFLPLVTASSRHRRLNHHLNDRIFISHHHEPSQGFANLEDLDSPFPADRVVSPTKPFGPGSSFDSGSGSGSGSEFVSGERRGQIVDERMLEVIRTMGQAVSMTSEIRRYIQDIVVFLRMERGVEGGVTPFATTMLVTLTKYLAPLHGTEFVTPSLVGLAVRKIYPHRIIITTPERERSMQWGSNLDAVKDLVDGLTPETVIDNILLKVTCPV